MALKDKILAHINEHGPISDSDLSDALNQPQPSFRRARNQLVVEGHVAEHAKRGNIVIWGKGSGEPPEPREKVKAASPTPMIGMKKNPPPHMTETDEDVEERIAAVKKDVMSTDFTF